MTKKLAKNNDTSKIKKEKEKRAAEIDKIADRIMDKYESVFKKLAKYE